MGWNDCARMKDSLLLIGIPKNAMFYFVHSYHIVCNNPEDILTTTTYDYPFTSAIQKDNIFGVQFHPEKSHDAGERLLRNFVDI
jgi:glutamine amidotransferase